MADGGRSYLAPRVLRDGHRIYWWLEAGLVVAIVLVVAVVVPAIHPPGVPPGALGNAIDLVHFERTFGLFFEHGVQRAAFDIGSGALIAANWWYCIMHFVVTAAVFVWLFRRTLTTTRAGATPLRSAQCSRSPFRPSTR